MSSIERGAAARFEGHAARGPVAELSCPRDDHRRLRLRIPDGAADGRSPTYMFAFEERTFAAGRPPWAQSRRRPAALNVRLWRLSPESGPAEIHPKRSFREHRTRRWWNEEPSENNNGVKPLRTLPEGLRKATMMSMLCSVYVPEG
jgi:hypothetical protein